MIFKISPKLSEARDLARNYWQTVPQTRPCNSKASITNSVVGACVYFAITAEQHCCTTVAWQSTAQHSDIYSFQS